MGNIGDSRAVLGTKDENTGEVMAIQITVDLKPDLPSMFIHIYYMCMHFLLFFNYVSNTKSKCNN